MNKIIVFLSILFVSFFSFIPGAHAQSYMRGGESTTLGKSEVINHDYFAAGQSVALSGTVNGDAYLAGSSLTVDGVVNGDLIAAGSDITIRGKVTGDVRVGGANVNIDGTIGGNLTVGAGKVYVADSAVLGGSILAGAGELTVLTPIKKDIVAGVGKFTLDKPVKGDVNYWSDQELSLGKEATISGLLTRHETPKQEKVQAEQAAKAATKAGFGFNLIKTLGLFIVGLIFLKLAPLYASAVVVNIKTKPWSSLGIGFAALILLPIGAIILLFTIIGAPITLLAFIALIVLSMFAKILGAYFAGNLLLTKLTKNANPYGSLAVGFLIFLVLAIIPILGWLTIAAVYLMAMGSIIAHHRELYLSLRNKKLV